VSERRELGLPRESPAGTLWERRPAAMRRRGNL